MPDEGFDAGVELSCLDTYAMWRHIQLFMLSAQSTINNGLIVKPSNKIRPDVFSKLRDQEEGYSHRSLYNFWDGTWYQYRYSKVCDVYPPQDNGRMYYNKLANGTVDKHQRTYKWSDTKYEADSIFVANLDKPTDVGAISYQPIGGEKYIKQRLDYVFSENEWMPIYNIITQFTPPYDHESSYCSGYKLFTRKYNFDEATEEYTKHDYDFGYNEGSCGFTGYLMSGTSTAYDFSMVGSFNGFSINNAVLKQHMIDSGIKIITSDIGLRMNADGSISPFGGMYFGQNDILTFRAINNIVTFYMPEVICIGSLAFNPDGTIDGELFANINKSYTIVGQPDIYTVQDIKIKANGTNVLSIEVNNGSGVDSSGTISLTIT